MIMMYLKLGAIGLLLTLVSLTSHAQQFLGKVIDTSGNPIFGVNVISSSSGAHSHSDANGVFQIISTLNDSLEFSALGFLSVKKLARDLEQNSEITLEESEISLTEITINPQVNSLESFSKINLSVNPVNHSQEVLRKVPGLFIGQHAGGGKAEQIFLRGFDIDHGTDISLEVDGIPVNMVSHAHGQGYSDLHFIIPETIEKIGFGKGPYEVSQGNFSTAGFVNFKTKTRLKDNLIKFERGQFNTSRVVGLFNLINSEKTSLYLASEYQGTDGPFLSPQDFSRLNIMTKLNVEADKNTFITISASYFNSAWDASGQIPIRAVDNGRIDRFGAIDDTEGGFTDRTNVSFNIKKHLNETSFLESTSYYSNYNFLLYSNFTFFLEDSINGDQIRQRESRNLFGNKTRFKKYLGTGELKTSLELGATFRRDEVSDVELSRTKNRNETLENIRLGDVSESNLGAYGSVDLKYKKWSAVGGLRIDHFDFSYQDQLTETYDKEKTTNYTLSPKLNLLYNSSRNLQYYLKLGRSFHSNDSRVILSNTVSSSLPSASGADVGFIWKPSKRLIINAAAWYLLSEQEFVYVGDAGIVEPSGETERRGVDVSTRAQVLKHLFIDLDANYTLSNSVGVSSEESFIPLAPTSNLTCGINYYKNTGFRAGLNFRYLADRPANEDNSIVAEGYTVTDFQVGYSWTHLDLGIQVQNVFDEDWNETQFATESRLFNEDESVTEIHFTPGTPFFIRGMLSYKF